MSLWTKIKGVHNAATEALSDYIEENNTWDEMRASGSLPIGTNKESADYIANFLTDPLNVIFTALGVGSSWRLIANPKKLLSFVDKVSDANKSKTAVALVKQEKIVNNYVNKWEDDFIKNNVIPQIHTPTVKNLDKVIEGFQDLSKAELEKLPKSEFFKSPNLKKFIEGFKLEMLEKRPWRYSNDSWRDLEKSYMNNAEIKEVVKGYEKNLMRQGEVVKEYGTLDEYAQFKPDIKLQQTKNIEELKTDKRELEEKWESIKNMDVFDFLK